MTSLQINNRQGSHYRISEAVVPVVVTAVDTIEDIGQSQGVRSGGQVNELEYSTEGDFCVNESDYRDYFVIECIDVSLWLKRKTKFIALHILKTIL